MTECKARHAEVNRDGERMHSVSQWGATRDSKGCPTYEGMCLSCGELVQSDGSGRSYGIEWAMTLAGSSWD